MEKSIIAELERIAATEQIKILHACESGSRAWGFPSPDSDYDVRFIYLRRLDWYLSIDRRRDTIELPINSILDINGWDLCKALKLFHGSNSVVYEWLQSPIIYQSSPDLARELLGLADLHYSCRAGIHHYLNMAIGCEQEHLRSPQVRLKKYFYALRPILAAMWIVKHRAVPPMEFEKLLVMVADRSDLLAAIHELLRLKYTANESTEITAVPILNDFILTEIASCAAAVKTIPKHHADSAPLNALFRKYALSSSGAILGSDSSDPL
jgi:uncharacterized protein